jgi:hypothetical protein
MVAVYWVLGARFSPGEKVAVLPLTLTVPVTAAPPGVVFKVKVVVFSVAGAIAFEKVADTEVFKATPVAALAGLVEDTVGRVTSVPVVKFQGKLAASAVPAASRAPVVMVAVYSVLGARFSPGEKVAVLPLTLTVPVTAAPSGVFFRVKVVVFSVEFVMATEKVADTEGLRATPVALLSGLVEDTVGGVAVVKLQM